MSTPVCAPPDPADGPEPLPEGGALVLGEYEQQDLLEVPEMERVLVESERQNGIHTGEHLKRDEPRRYDLICRLLRAGVLTQREVAEACKTSCGLVGSVSKQMGLVGAETRKKRRAAGWGKVETLAQAVAIESLQDALTDPEYRKKKSLSEIAIIGGTAHDKRALDEGEATARLEVVQGGQHEEYLDYIESLRRVEDVTEMGTKGLLTEGET
jgi:hypothetical protein